MIFPIDEMSYETASFLEIYDAHLLQRLKEIYYRSEPEYTRVQLALISAFSINTRKIIT